MIFKIFVILIFIFAVGCHPGSNLQVPSQPAVTSQQQPQQTPSLSNRLVIQPGEAKHVQTVFPSASESWELIYQFIVPPTPKTKTWDPSQGTYFIWGDVDFDEYTINGPYSISSDYAINQIVPQLMIGDVTSISGFKYRAIDQEIDQWVIQAQYFWTQQKDKKQSASYAQAGDIIPVNPGDLVTTRIAYDSSTGQIEAKIFTSLDKVSKITIERPFPNTSPPLFASWKEYFERAEMFTRAKLGEKSPKGVFGQAVVNVETYNVDEETLCSSLPLELTQMDGPNFPKTKEGFHWRSEGSFKCPFDPMKIDF